MKPSASRIWIEGRRSERGARPCWWMVSVTFQGLPVLTLYGVEESLVVTTPPATAAAGAVRSRNAAIKRQRRMILVATCTRLPPGPVALHHSPAVQRSGVGQRAAEAPERHLVLRAQEQEALAVRPHRNRLAAQIPDRREVVGERQRLDLVRRAVYPHRPLGRVQAVVHAVDQVPRHRPARLGHAHARRPAPGGLARVVAGGVVDEAAALERPPQQRAADREAGLLARPDVLGAVG